MRTYTGTDLFTGENYSFSLTNVETDYIENNLCIKATITTNLGQCSLLEWITDGHVERTDSHIRINEVNNIISLFDINNKPNSMPIEDFLPLKEIYDALDQELSYL